MKDLLRKLDEPPLRQESLFAIRQFLIVYGGFEFGQLRNLRWSGPLLLFRLLFYAACC